MFKQNVCVVDYKINSIQTQFHPNSIPSSIPSVNPALKEILGNATFMGKSYSNAIYISRTIIHRYIGYEPLCEPIDPADDSL